MPPPPLLARKLRLLQVPEKNIEELDFSKLERLMELVIVSWLLLSFLANKTLSGLRMDTSVCTKSRIECLLNRPTLFGRRCKLI